MVRIREAVGGDRAREPGDIHSRRSCPGRGQGNKGEVVIMEGVLSRKVGLEGAMRVKEAKQKNKH